MNTSPDIWVAFVKTFSMLFLVLALLILAFYLIKRISAARGVKGSKNHIRILSVHHLSPKEKLVLLDVLGDILLIGVTPANISRIASFEKNPDLLNEAKEPSFKFSDLLAQKSGSSFKNKGNDLPDKGDR